MARSLQATPLKQTSFHWVHLVALDGKTLQKQGRATCVLDQTGHITFQGDKTLVEQLKMGVETAAHKTMLPKDGLAFLEVLGEAFQSPYLFATPIQAGKKVVPFVSTPLNIK